MPDGMTLPEIMEGLVRNCMKDLGLKNRIPTEREFNRWFFRGTDLFLEKPDEQDERTRAVMDKRAEKRDEVSDHT